MYWNAISNGSFIPQIPQHSLGVLISVTYKKYVYSYYNWQELPQVQFLSWQNSCCNTHVCYDKTHLLSWQNYACCNKTFVATKLCLLWQKHVCHDKNMFVMTKVLLRQTYFCHNKRCVLLRKTRVCCDKSFVTTKNYTCGNSYQW